MLFDKSSQAGGLEAQDDSADGATDASDASGRANRYSLDKGWNGATDSSMDSLIYGNDGSQADPLDPYNQPSYQTRNAAKNEMSDWTGPSEANPFKVTSSEQRSVWNFLHPSAPMNTTAQLREKAALYRLSSASAAGGSQDLNSKSSPWSSLSGSSADDSLRGLDNYANPSASYEYGSNEKRLGSAGQDSAILRATRAPTVLDPMTREQTPPPYTPARSSADLSRRP